MSDTLANPAATPHASTADAPADQPAVLPADAGGGATAQALVDAGVKSEDIADVEAPVKAPVETTVDCPTIGVATAALQHTLHMVEILEPDNVDPGSMTLEQIEAEIKAYGDPRDPVLEVNDLYNEAKAKHEAAVKAGDRALMLILERRQSLERQCGQVQHRMNTLRDEKKKRG